MLYYLTILDAEGFDEYMRTDKPVRIRKGKFCEENYKSFEVWYNTIENFYKVRIDEKKYGVNQGEIRELDHNIYKLENMDGKLFVLKSNNSMQNWCQYDDEKFRIYKLLQYYKGNTKSWLYALLIEKQNTQN